MLIVHGDADHIAPIGASALASAKIVKDATLKVYPGASRRGHEAHQHQFNADMLAILRA